MGALWHVGMGVAVSFDEGKIVAFVLACVAFLALARWAGRISESQVSHEPPTYLDQFANSARPSSLDRDPYDVVRSFPHDPALGPIQILRFYFLKFDALSGPPDPDSFADELIVRLYDGETEDRWEQYYFVATPKGLQDVLKTKTWSYLHAESVIVVNGYDLETIRQAVVARIVETHENVPAEEKNGQGEEAL
jgi:hypothetical protein